MAQPRFTAPSLQELVLAYQSGPKGGAELEAVRGGLKSGLGIGINLQDRARKLKSQLEEFKLEQGKARETKRATRVSEAAAVPAAKSKQALESAKTKESEARAEFLRRKPGSPPRGKPPLSDLEIDIQAEKDAQAFIKTYTAGTGVFGQPELAEIKNMFKDQRVTEMIEARDKEIEENLVRVIKADGTTGRVPKEKLDSFLQTFPGSKVIK